MQTSPVGHVQLSVPPHPLETRPQPRAAQVVGVQQVPLSQTSLPVQLPQERVPPHPFGILPHIAFCAWQVVGVHGLHVLGVPLHRSPVWHVPQESVPPQPSEMDPHLSPCAAQVVLVQQVPLSQTSPLEQLPHERVPPQPSEIDPQLPLWQVFGVHTPHVPFWHVSPLGQVPQLDPQTVPQVHPFAVHDVVHAPHVPFVHICPPEHPAQWSVPPQPSGWVLSQAPRAAQVVGAHAPQTLLVHVWPEGHPPHWTLLPQSFVIVPQFFPCWAQGLVQTLFEHVAPTPQ